MESEFEMQVIRKVTMRIIPFIMLLYFMNFLDRVNAGFAALSMNKAIGLTPAMFGFGGSLFGSDGTSYQMSKEKEAGGNPRRRPEHQCVMGQVHYSSSFPT